MASISVAATDTGWPLDRILRERLWSRSTYATTTVGTVRRAGYELLATHSRPHYGHPSAFGDVRERHYAVVVVRSWHDQPVSPADEVRDGI